MLNISGLRNEMHIWLCLKVLKCAMLFRNELIIRCRMSLCAPVLQNSASQDLWNQSVEVQAGGGAEVGEAAVADGVCAVDECVGDGPVKCLPLQG